jgi:hypothetical protein
MAVHRDGDQNRRDGERNPHAARAGRFDYLLVESTRI